MNYRHLSHLELERLAAKQERMITRLKRHYFTDQDVAHLIEEKHRIERLYAELQEEHHKLFIRLQQNRLYLNDIDIVEFYKSVDNLE